ncbi:MAG: hypothetical protein ACFN9G_09605 [Cardiobacterium sp.]
MPMTSSQILTQHTPDFSRQLKVAGMTPAAQAALARARIIIFGAGGLAATTARPGLPPLALATSLSSMPTPSPPATCTGKRPTPTPTSARQKRRQRTAHNVRPSRRRWMARRCSPPCARTTSRQTRPYCSSAPAANARPTHTARTLRTQGYAQVFAYGAAWTETMP